MPRESWPVFRGVGWLHRGQVGGATSDTETRERLRATPPDIPRHAETVGPDQTAEPRGPQPSPGRILYGLGSAARNARGAFSALAEPLACNRRRSFPRAAIFVRHRRIYDRQALRRRPTSLSESTRTRIMTPGARQRDRIKCTVVRCRGGVFLAPSGRFQLHSVASVEWDEARNYACMPARSQVRRLPLARLALTRG